MSQRRLQLDDAFLQCRARNRHNWEEVPDDGGMKRTYKESRAVARLTSRCTTCGTTKLEIWSKVTGEIVSTPEYRYPDGYQYAKDDRPDRNAFRKEFLKRDLRKTTLRVVRKTA